MSTFKDFLAYLDSFYPQLDVSDHVWPVLFPDSSGKWRRISVQKYKETYFFWSQQKDLDSLEYSAAEGVKASDRMGFHFRPVSDERELAHWTKILEAAYKWLKKVEKDWYAANKQVELEYPLAYRTGIVPSSIVRDAIPDIYSIPRELGAAKTKKIIDLIDRGAFQREGETILASMTAEKYFEYCRIAYIAGQRKEDKIDKRLSGREMYEAYADGRHEGLLDIDMTSPEEFASWIDRKHPRRMGGGHPWEIKRGGNTTHIDLSVFRPQYREDKGFIIELCGESWTRMVETLQMLLAIHEANLPISIRNPLGVRHRLIGTDNIGIIPEGESLHRANQTFPSQDLVYDVTHYQTFGRKKRRVAPFITWKPLPLMIPRKVHGKVTPASSGSRRKPS